MAASKGLGKGLGALFGDMPPSEPQQGSNQELPVQKIEPNPFQPRKRFDPEELQTLADSISKYGIIQPLTVRALDNGYYQIIAGERRWRAARMAGLSEVPAIIVEADDKTTAELALIENLQRQDLDPVEEAQGYKRLLDEYGMTQEQIAASVGKSRPAVANALRLLALPEDLLDLLSDGTITPGHARALLSLPDEQRQREVAERIVRNELSVRQTETLCKALLKEPAAPEPVKNGLEVDYIAECEKTLSSAMGRAVRIVSGQRKGKLELEFYGPDDLQKLLEQLGGDI